MMIARRNRTTTALLLAMLIGCGGPAAEPEPEPTQGAEADPPPPPPPPPPASVRVVHASPDPAAATVSLSAGGAEPVVRDLAYRSSSAYLGIPPGHVSLAVLGVPSVETGEAPELAVVEADLEPARTYTAILHGLPGGEPALALATMQDRDGAPAEGSAGVRFFHGIVGVAAIDVCRPGATPREQAIPLFANVETGAMGATDAGSLVDVPAGAELAIQLRQQNPTPCRGRVLGVARITPSAGASHTLVAVGRTTGAPRADRELLVCTDGSTEPCATVAIANR